MQGKSKSFSTKVSREFWVFRPFTEPQHMFCMFKRIFRDFCDFYILYKWYIKPGISFNFQLNVIERSQKNLINKNSLRWNTLHFKNASKLGENACEVFSKYHISFLEHLQTISSINAWSVICWNVCCSKYCKLSAEIGTVFANIWCQ